MVNVASGAGASSGPSLKIRGSLMTSALERGFQSIKTMFQGVKSYAKGFSADMIRIGQASKDVAKWMQKWSVVGVSAMVGIATKAPAVAPALAQMGVAFGKLQRSLGEALAPSFEKVAGWLDKLAVWVGENESTISSISGTILDWAEKVGNFLAPALEKVGQWASDHPKFFAALFAGIVLGPTAVKGISAINGLVTTIAASTVGTTLITALSYLAAIGGAAYVGYKGASAVVDKLQNWTGMGTDPNAPTDMSGQTLLNRMGEKSWASFTGGTPSWQDQFNPNSPAHYDAIQEIKNQPYSPTPNGMISAAREEDRRFFLLNWWDQVWG